MKPSEIDMNIDSRISTFIAVAKNLTQQPGQPSMEFLPVTIPEKGAPKAVLTLIPDLDAGAGNYTGHVFVMADTGTMGAIASLYTNRLMQQAEVQAVLFAAGKNAKIELDQLPVILPKSIDASQLQNMEYVTTYLTTAFACVGIVAIKNGRNLQVKDGVVTRKAEASSKFVTDYIQLLVREGHLISFASLHPFVEGDGVSAEYGLIYAVVTHMANTNHCFVFAFPNNPEDQQIFTIRDKLALRMSKFPGSDGWTINTMVLPDDCHVNFDKPHDQQVDPAWFAELNQTLKVQEEDRRRPITRRQAREAQPTVRSTVNFGEIDPVILAKINASSGPERSDHWSKFLRARALLIASARQGGMSDEQITQMLQMDVGQVTRIRESLQIP